MSDVKHHLQSPAWAIVSCLRVVDQAGIPSLGFDASDFAGMVSLGWVYPTPYGKWKLSASGEAVVALAALLIQEERRDRDVTDS